MSGKKPEERLPFNPFTKFGADWALLTAGRKTGFNTMTVSWGGMGVLWGKNICFCVVRPGRHTFGFMEKEELFTLSFFPRRFRKALQLCGTLSGRETDKTARAGLHPVFPASGGVTFREASLVFICRKIYFHDLDARNFLSPDIIGHYPEKDFHRLYIGSVKTCTRKRNR